MIRRRGYLFVLLMLAGLFSGFATGEAYAQANPILSNYTCVGGVAAGQLLNSGTCPTSLNTDNFFSFLMCNMELLSSNLIGHMYCSMMTDLTPIVLGFLTLAVTLFGISFSFGIVPMRASEAMRFLFKIGLVTAFAFHADTLIGTGYNLLISGMKDGITIILKTIIKDGGGTFVDGNEVYALIDSAISKGFHAATDSLNPSTVAERCKNALFGVIAVFAAAFPLAAYLAIALLARIIISLFRAVFGYLNAFIGITFLMALAPFFLSFAMFRPTTKFFERWLGYMISFTLQVVLLFVFLGFIFTMRANKGMVENINDIIVENQQSVSATSFRMPWDYCTVCRFEIIDKSQLPAIVVLNQTNAKGDIVGYQSNGKLQCKLFPKNPPGDLHDDTKITTFDCPNSFCMAPVEPLTAMSTVPGTTEIGPIITLCVYGLLSLIVLAWVVERILANLPSIAQVLASGMNANYAPLVGGGESMVGAPSMGFMGQGLAKDFEAGFRGGMRNTTSKSGAGAAADSFKKGLDLMLTGKNAAGEQVAGTGMGSRFTRWLFDPLGSIKR